MKVVLNTCSFSNLGPSFRLYEESKITRGTLGFNLLYAISLVAADTLPLRKCYHPSKLLLSASINFHNFILIYLQFSQKRNKPCWGKNRKIPTHRENDKQDVKECTSARFTVTVLVQEQYYSSAGICS